LLLAGVFAKKKADILRWLPDAGVVAGLAPVAGSIGVFMLAPAELAMMTLLTSMLQQQP
jgi:hypothetical protein